MENCIVIGIKHVMMKKGLYQKTVAARAGFTQQQFSDMLNQRKVIRAEYLPQIAKALGVSVADLFAADEEKAS